jgi:DNA-directed RNA polymerase subunit RPC12/RpoP
MKNEIKMTCEECKKESNTFYNWQLISVNNKVIPICPECQYKILIKYYKENIKVK